MKVKYFCIIFDSKKYDLIEFKSKLDFHISKCEHEECQKSREKHNFDWCDVCETYTKDAKYECNECGQMFCYDRNADSCDKEKCCEDGNSCDDCLGL